MKWAFRSYFVQFSKCPLKNAKFKPVYFRYLPLQIHTILEIPMGKGFIIPERNDLYNPCNMCRGEHSIRVKKFFLRRKEKERHEIENVSSFLNHFHCSFFISFILQLFLLYLIATK